MDELIGTFIRAHFSEELVEEIYTSFGLFGLFNHGDGFEAFDSILSTESTADGTALADEFIAQLNTELNYLLEHHTLLLDGEATIEQKNSILQGLYQLQYLEDYAPILTVFESDLSDEEKIVQIVVHVTSMEESLVMDLIEGCRPSFLTTLHQYALERPVQPEDPSPLAVVRANLRLYREVFGQSEFAQTLLESDILPAMPFASYLPFIQTGMTDAKLEDASLRIYWTLLLSSDGSEQPLPVYRHYSDQLLQNVDHITQVERMIISYIGRIEELRKVRP